MSMSTIVLVAVDTNALKKCAYMITIIIIIRSAK